MAFSNNHYQFLLELPHTVRVGKSFFANSNALKFSTNILVSTTYFIEISDALDISSFFDLCLSAYSFQQVL